MQPVFNLPQHFARLGVLVELPYRLMSIQIFKVESLSPVSE